MAELLGYQFDRTYAGAIERYRQVATIAARDAIPNGKRWEGMLCYVTGENKDYQLRGGLTNLDWDEVATGGGNFFDTSINDSDDITEGIVHLFMDSAEQAKLAFISVTQAVDLDQMETDIAALGSGVTFKGTWSPSGGSFPGGGTTAVGDLYIADDSGTIDSVSFVSGDGVIAIVVNASTSTFSANWAKTESVSDVTSVAGLTGVISKSALLAALNVEDGATADQTGSDIATLLDTFLTSAAWRTQLTTEEVMDIVGGGIAGTQTRITVSYDDPNGKIDFVVEAPILVYADLATAVAAQGSQSDTQIIEFTNASDFTDVSSGRAWARYLGTTNENETDYRIISKEESVSQTPPIPLTYADDTALFAGQGNQTTNFIYEVTDGSGFTGVSSGAIWVKYLGTTVGDETDYIIVSQAVVSGAGTVTSVAVSGSDGIEVDSGSPITSSGTIALGINAANLRSHINVEDGADVTDAENVEDAITSTSADTLTDTSVLPFVEAATLVKITWANFKAAIKTYTDTLYVAIADYLEEKLNGTADEALTVTGATNLDLSAAAHRNIKLTGNATLTFTNTPASGKTITRTYKIYSDTTETLGFANSTAEYGEYTADGTENLVTVMASNTGTEGLDIHVFFSIPS